MKKAAKIGISIGSVAVMVLAVSTTVNLWVKSLVCRQLEHNIASADSLVIQYDDIQLAVFRGKAWITDVYFRSDTLAWDQATGNIAESHIDELSLDGINYFNWLIRRQLNLRGLTVINPTFRMRFLHEPNKAVVGDALQQQLERERIQRLENMMNIARIFIDDATLHRLTIDHANVQAEAINDSLKISIPEFTMSLYDLGYNIRDSLPHYNDSVFHFLIRDVDVHVPEVMLSLTVKQLRAEPSGVVQINDVRVRSGLNTQQNEYITTGAHQIDIGGFDVAKFNALKQMDVKNIHIHQFFANLQIDESPKSPAARRQSQTQLEYDAINQKMAESNMDMIEEFITGLTVDTIFLHDAMINVQSITSAFSLQANHISTAVYGVGYSLIDQIPYHYNDSVYQFAMGCVDVVTPDGWMAIGAQDIHYDNGGAFALGKTHIRHTIDRWELAHQMGDVPATLIDMRVDSVYTSSKNILREAFSLDKSFRLDTLYADIASMRIFRDARFPAKRPYQLPQEVISQITYPFTINCVKAKVQSMHIETGLTQENVGSLDLGPIAMTVNNVSPIRNSVISARAHGRLGHASVDALIRLTMNQACQWDVRLDATHLDFHSLDHMLYPLVGMRIGCDVHRLHAAYSGDTAVATGTFCMEYNDIDIFADKDSNSPYTIIKDLSGLINSAGKTLVNQSNPAPGQQPLSYQVKWKNNRQEDPSLYYLGPLIDGCIKTMLPGLFVHKRVKNK